MNRWINSIDQNPAESRICRCENKKTENLAKKGRVLWTSDEKGVYERDYERVCACFSERRLQS